MKTNAWRKKVLSSTSEKAIECEFKYLGNVFKSPKTSGVNAYELHLTISLIIQVPKLLMSFPINRAWRRFTSKICHQTQKFDIERERGREWERGGSPYFIDYPTNCIGVTETLLQFQRLTKNKHEDKKSFVYINDMYFLFSSWIEWRAKFLFSSYDHVSVFY